ncbi:hypothetical protein [Paramagnetospirillum marisnigri]|uniref:hypothetical protein n=1 Tax=Paramagnetospirillum marisnigri TaxID=1285242 RepID=UPI000AAF02FB|nr:hypothetical protein [Paramagnetospirillum marisnigri]
MYFTTMDIVMAALAVLALVGAAISLSAWRHAVRVEREDAKAADPNLASTI